MLHDVIGNWSGMYELWFEPGDSISTSPSTLSVSSTNNDGLVAEYTWIFDGMHHSGKYTLSPEGSVVFVDSFHTSGSEMTCSANSAFDVTGTYEAGDETWGWRTALNMASPDELTVTAWNVTPAGEETLATRATYSRA